MFYDESGKPRWEEGLPECRYCGHPDIDHSDIDGEVWCGNYMEGTTGDACPCHMVRKAVLDERERAAERVAALPSWNYTYGDNPPFVELPAGMGPWMVRSEAVAAARGGE